MANDISCFFNNGTSHANLFEMDEDNGSSARNCEKTNQVEMENTNFSVETCDGTNTTDRTTHKTEKRFFCIDCGKSFTRKSSLIVHQRIHTGEKLFMCTECGKRFGLKSSLVRHLRTHIPKTLNICPDCGKGFSRYSSLFQHQKVHRREKAYKCCHCEKSFSCNSLLAAHQAIHKTNELSDGKQHGEQISDQVKINELCRKDNMGELPAFKEFARSFIREESGMRPPPPYTGNSTFFSKMECVEISISSQDGETEVDAPKPASKRNSYMKPCKTDIQKENHSIEESTVLSVELERTTRKEEKSFLCINCGKSFTRKSSLIVHQRTHTGEKLFMCTECGKRFGLKSSLVRHIRTHLPKTINICTECGKCFSRYTSLFQHQKSHRLEKPFKCSQCEKRFSRTLQLLIHQKGHKSGKGFDKKDHREKVRCQTKFRNGSRCDRIQETFRQKESLLLHHRIHTVDSPHPDSPDTKTTTNEKSGNPKVSPKKCSKEPELLALEKTEKVDSLNGEKRCLCIDCGKSFTRKSSLIVHQRIHTGEKLYMCTECGKRFGLKSSLVRHMRTHIPKSLNICPDCGKCFSRYSSLFQHQKVHRRFSWPSQLLLQRNHKGEKLVESENNYAQDKYREHTGSDATEMSHQCLPRDKSVSEVAALIRHKRTHRDSSKSRTKHKDGEPSHDHSDSLDRNSSLLSMPSHAEEHFKIPCNTGPIITKPVSEEQRPNGLENQECSEKCRDRSIKITPSEEKQHLCSECGKNFTRKSSLIVHQRSHTGEKLYMCSECGKRFGLKSSLVRHLKTHTGPAINICSECGLYFSHYSNLLLHLQIHNGQQQLNSSDVSKQEPKESNDLLEGQESLKEITILKEEEIRGSKNQQPLMADPVHVNQLLDSKCSDDKKTNLCEASMQVKEELPENIYTAGDQNTEEEKNEEFPACPYLIDWGVEFDISKSLNADHNPGKVHETLKRNELHSDKGSSVGQESPSFEIWGRSNSTERPYCGEKRFLCIDCEKSFTRKSSLIVHQRTHTGEKLYMCTECGKRFGLKSSLVRHHKIHSTEFFTCTQCGKSFRDYSKFLQHQANHTGEWSYREPHLTVL